MYNILIIVLQWLRAASAKQLLSTATTLVKKSLKVQEEFDATEAALQSAYNTILAVRDLKDNQTSDKLVKIDKLIKAAQK